MGSMQSSYEASIRRVSCPVKRMGEKSELSTTEWSCTPASVCKQGMSIFPRLDVPVFELMYQVASTAGDQGVEVVQSWRKAPFFASTRASESEIWVKRSWSLRPEAHNGGRPSSVSALRTAK
jgi:hypothetical protein